MYTFCEIKLVIRVGVMDAVILPWRIGQDYHTYLFVNLRLTKVAMLLESMGADSS